MSFTDSTLFSPAPSWEIDDIFASTPNPAAAKNVKMEDGSHANHHHHHATTAATPGAMHEPVYEQYEQVESSNVFYAANNADGTSESNHSATSNSGEYEMLPSLSTTSSNSSHPPVAHPHHHHHHSYSSESTSSISSASSSPEHIQNSWEQDNSVSSSPTTPEYVENHHHHAHPHVHHTHHHHHAHHTHHTHSHERQHQTTHHAHHNHHAHQAYFPHTPQLGLNTVHEEAVYDSHTHTHASQHDVTPSVNTTHSHPHTTPVANTTPVASTFNFPLSAAQYADGQSSGSSSDKSKVKRRQKYTTAAAASEAARASVVAASTPTSTPSHTSGRSNNSTPILAARAGKASASASASGSSSSGSSSGSGSGSDDSDGESGDYSFSRYGLDGGHDGSDVLSSSLFTGSSMPNGQPSLHKTGSSSESTSRKKRRDRNISLYPPTGNRTKKMLEEFERIAAEALPPHASKRERNKLSASMYRKRRKIYLDTLEDKVNLLESNLRQQTDAMSSLEMENKALKEQLMQLQKVVEKKDDSHPHSHPTHSQSSSSSSATVGNPFTPGNGFQRSLVGGRGSGTMLMFVVLCCVLLVQPFLFHSDSDSASGSPSPMGRRLLSIEEDVTVYNDRYTTRTVHVYSSSSMADSFLPFPLSSLDSTLDWLVDSFRHSLNLHSGESTVDVTSLPVSQIPSATKKGNGNNYSSVETPAAAPAPATSSCDALSGDALGHPSYDCGSLSREHDELEEQSKSRVKVNVVHHPQKADASLLA